MVYKKYIKRAGKTYGPYFYKSVKKDGKVITEYMGKSPETTPLKKYFMFGIFSLIVLSSLFMIVTFDLTITGKVTLDVESVYQQNQHIEGMSKFLLTKGEIIPSSSIVQISLGTFSNNYTLSEVISDEQIEGDFNIKNKKISGSGKGYGPVPDDSAIVIFQLNILPAQPEEKVGEPEQIIPTPENITPTPEESEQPTPENITLAPEESEQPTPENITQPPTPIDSEPPTPEPTSTEPEQPSPETEQDVEQSEEKATDSKDKKEEEPKQEEKEVPEPISIIPITGKVISGFDNRIFGNVSSESAFTYNLEEGQTAEIISSNQDVDLQIENNIVTVTTKYKGKQTTELTINLSTLKIPAQEGTLTLSIIYNGTELFSTNQKIKVRKTEELVNKTSPINQTSFTIETSKTTYLENETIYLSGRLIINETGVSDEILLEIELNQSLLLTTNITVINGSYKYSLIADFKSEGIYSLKVSLGDLFAQTSFYFVKTNYTLIEGFICKEFKENILWSSGYAQSRGGSTEYYTWFPENNCSEVGNNDCLLHDITIKTRFLQLNPSIADSQGEGYIQISEPDESICNNPAEGNYSKYLAHKIFLEGEKNWEKYCKKDKNSISRCSVKVGNNYSNDGNCYGIKVHASQYSIVDVVEIKYDLCWREND